MLADLFELGRDFALAAIVVLGCWLVAAAGLAWAWSRAARLSDDV